MAAGVNNIYRGQYRAERRLDVDFGSLWAKMGVETKDDSVRAVLQAVT